MKLLRLIFGTSLGKKYVMALTGLGLFLFVIVHMLGNLQIFLGRDTLNAYGALLKSIPELLWGARIGLLSMVVLHIFSAISLVNSNRAARPVVYRQSEASGASYASRTMAWSGTIVLAFILFHLAHFTVGWVDPGYLKLEDAQGRHDVYGMVVAGFSHLWVSVFYIVAMALLCMHLSHGVGSLFQSLGLKNQRTASWIDGFGVGMACLIFLGNCSIPVAILLGYGQS